MDSTQVAFPDALLKPSVAHNDGWKPDEPAEVEKFAASDASREFSDKLWVPPSEWKDRARENDKLEIWAENRRNRFTNQQHPRIRGMTHECTCHSGVCQGFEVAYNAQRGKNGIPVFMAALSVYNEANPRRSGGASCIHVLNIMARRGALPEHNGPNGTDQRKLFMHTIHCTEGKGNANCSRGPWVSLEEMPPNWEETARHFRVTEAIICKNVEQAVSCILHGRVVNVGRNGHAIPWNRVVWRDGRMYLAYADSYDVIRYDDEHTAKYAARGASCIWNVTDQDDWDFPARIAA